MIFSGPQLWPTKMDQSCSEDDHKANELLQMCRNQFELHKAANIKALSAATLFKVLHIETKQNKTYMPDKKKTGEKLQCSLE